MLDARYLVRYVDLREPKPREVREDVYAMEKEYLAALGLLGMNAADFITVRYERGGYHVIRVERISQKRTVTLDIHKLWQETEPESREVSAND